MTIGSGYVAWSKTDHIRKSALVGNLTDRQRSDLAELIRVKTLLANSIMKKKLCNLIGLPIDLLASYSLRQLNRLSGLVEACGYESIVCVLPHVKLEKVTKYNVRDLCRYIRDLNAFKEGCIHVTWGPGNNGSPSENAIRHMRKHLTDAPLGVYIETPVQLFYYMRDVVVHSNGRGTYMSGFYDNLFIVGRYCGDAFGISSCYLVASGHKEGRLKDMCFLVW